MLRDKVRSIMAAIVPAPRERLKAMGIKGRPGNPKFCVIAEYVKQRVPEAKEVNMGGTGVLSFRDKNGNEYRENYGQLYMFLNAFDTKQYPELIK